MQILHAKTTVEKRGHGFKREQGEVYGNFQREEWEGEDVIKI